jgi:site-specific recombinase XerD
MSVNATRHSWACQRLNAGLSSYQISTVLGRTSTQMMKRYAEYAGEELGSVFRGEGSVHTLITLPKTPNY